MRALDLAASVPWAILPESLQLIFSIAAREHEPDFAAAAAKLAARHSELGDPSSVSVTPGKRVEGTQLLRMRGSIAVLAVEGPIFRYANLFSALSGATSIEMLAKDLRVAVNDPDVKGILLHVDSPGGEVNGTGEFADMVYQARQRKPVAAYVSHLGASAAYWIASAADRIVVAPTSLVGSIGVVLAVKDPDRDRKESGEIEFVSSQSPRKRPDVSTKEGKSQIQAMVDDLADQFIANVARARGVSVEDVLSKYGGGDIFVGQKAVDAGLADEVGNFEKTLAEMEDEKPRKKRTSNTEASAGADTSTGSIPPSRASDEPAASESESEGKDAKHMTSLKDRLMAAIQGVPDEEGADASASQPAPAPVTVTNTVTTPAAPTTAPSITPPANAATPAGESDELRRMREQLAASEQEKRKLQLERIYERAGAFADKVIALDKKAYPAERERMIALYVRAASDDMLLPISDGPSRVDEIAAAYASRPKHMMDEEALVAGLSNLQVVANLQKTPQAKEKGPMDPERREFLLSQIPEGRTVLAEEKKNGAGR